MSQLSKQRSIPALYMRGGTSKGVFLNPDDLPADPAERDALLLRLMGSPDPYKQQLDGMGAATSSTSKVILVSRSGRPDSDVEYVFGQVSIDQQLVDWSGNCGNLTSAVGPYAIHRGLIKPPADGMTQIRLWQAGIQKKIIAHVPVRNGEVIEMGDFELDGVAFPAAEIRLDFIDPGTNDGASKSLFPTGRGIDELDVPGLGKVRVTLINAGNPTIFILAETLGLTGTELPAHVNGRSKLLAQCELIRANAAVAMGLAPTAEYATLHRQHTPKLAFVAAPGDYISTSGKPVQASNIDLSVRIISMGKLHHAMTGTGAVAIAAAAALPDTLVTEVLGRPHAEVHFGHPAGALKVGAKALQQAGQWQITQASMSRSARRLMDGVVFVPELRSAV